MVSNLGETMSPATNFDSWIELYNPSDTDVDLAGMYLGEWRMPNDIGVVPAHGFKVVWLGSNNIKANQAPFKLDCDGGTIRLSDTNGTPIVTQNYPAAKSRTSWARTTDGGDEWEWCSTPTAGTTNATATFASERLDPPTVDTDSKLFDGSLKVNVTIPEGTRLFYTIDGSVPTNENDNNYEDGNEDGWVEWIRNGDCEGTDVSCLIGKDGDSNGSLNTHIVNGVGYNGSRGIVVHAIDNPVNDWDTQFFIYTPNQVLYAGDSYHFSMKVRADKRATITVESQGTPSNYIHWQMLDQRYMVTTEWKEISYEGTVSEEQAGNSGLQTLAFKLNVEKFANNYYFDDISWMSSKGNIQQTSYESDDGQFTITKTTNLRFRLFKDGYLPSVPVTRSYIKTTNKYTIPVVSIVGDKRYFTDPEWGIDTKGTNGIPGNGQEEPCNWNMDWERPVNFSYIMPEGEMVVNQDVNIAVSGGWSRSSTPRSFKLKADKLFDGKNSIDYVFFNQKPYIRNKALLVRNGGNDNWDNNRSRFMDPALQTVVDCSGIDIDLQSYQPVAEYVNGIFQGILNLREPTNKKYVETNHGYDDDNIDMFENFEFKAGDAKVLNRIFQLGKQIYNSNAYEELKQLLDIDEFINYLAIELFLGSNDWPHNNVKAFRNQDDGRYRFILFDIDFAFNCENPFQNFTSQNYMQFVQFCTNLFKHEGFRKKFIDTYCIIAGSVFEPNRSIAIIDSLANRVRPMMKLDGEKSPDGAVEKIKSFLPTQMERMIELMQQYQPLKLAGQATQNIEVSANAKGAKILMNDIEVPYSTFNGKVFLPMKLEAIAPAGYQFAGWENTKEGTIISTANCIELSEQRVSFLKACFEPITNEERIRQSLAPIRINEVSAANNIYVNEYWKQNDWIELYNTTDEDIDLEGMYLSDNVDKTQKYQITAQEGVNLVIPAHGIKIVWCDKLEPIAHLHAPFKLDAGGGDLVLTAEDDSWSDLLHYEAHLGDETVGRYPDGTDSVYVTNTPTIAKANLRSSYAIPIEQPMVTSINTTVANNKIAIGYQHDRLIINDKEGQSVKICIINTMGQQLKTTSLKLHDGYTELPVSLPVGIYIFTIHDDAGNVVTFVRSKR